MRYRLMASYLGASYQAAVGPSDRDVTLFAAPPPPEEHGFSPAPGGVWRKQVRLGERGARAQFHHAFKRALFLLCATRETAPSLWQY